MDWDAVGQAAGWYTDQGYATTRRLAGDTSPDQNRFPVASAASLWKMHSLPRKRAPLLDLLKEFRLRLAGQQVDKLYATFGLAEEIVDTAEAEWNILLEPDYERGFEAVYRDAARFLIIQHGTLLVLSQVDRYPSEPPGLPSWVPDWGRIKGSSDLWTTAEQEGFGANGNEPLSMGIAENEDHLILEGVVADTAISHTNRLEGHGVGSNTTDKELSFIADAWRLTSSQRSTTGRDNTDPTLNTPRSFVEAITAGGRLPGGGNDIMKDASSWFWKHLSYDLENIGYLRQRWQVSFTSDRTRFHEAFVEICTDRRFFVTQGGLMGIGPAYMAAEDKIVVLFGAKVPFMMRKQGRRYRLIGECYVPGLMSGEAIEKWRESGGSRECFEIV